MSSPTFEEPLNQFEVVDDRVLAWWNPIDWLQWFVRQARWLQWLICCGTLVGIAASLQVDLPDGVVIPVIDWRLPETCWSRREMNLPCPGCGLTRCFIMAAHGNFVGAARMHPGGVLLFSFLALQIPLRLSEAWLVRKGKHASADRVHRLGILGGTRWIILAAVTVLAISLVQWLWRIAG